MGEDCALATLVMERDRRSCSLLARFFISPSTATCFTSLTSCIRCIGIEPSPSNATCICRSNVALAIAMFDVRISKNTAICKKLL